MHLFYRNVRHQYTYLGTPSVYQASHAEQADGEEFVNNISLQFAINSYVDNYS